jgi:hypothetical protein
MQVHYFHYMLWICLAAYSIHLLEEFTLDWRSWANKTLKMAPNSPQFYFVNATTLVLGFCCAMIGWWMPPIALMFPALMIINGLFFHILPALTQRRFTPGLFTAILVLLPVGVLCYYAANRDAVLDTLALVVSFSGAAVFVGYVLVLAKVGSRMKSTG